VREAGGVEVRAALGLASLAALGCSPSNGLGEREARIRSDLAWGQSQRIDPTSGVASSFFGSSIAASGDLALIGEPTANSNEGAVYVFARTGGSWSEEQKLLPSEPRANSVFGTSISLSGDTALVGARNASGGCVYVFGPSEEGFVEQQVLQASDGAPGNEFGQQVWHADDGALVGAPYADDQLGAVYAFTRTGTTWTEQQRLRASDAASTQYFGAAIAVTGDTAFVGAVDAVYVFGRSGTTWSEQQKLVNPEAQFFGTSLAASLDTVLIGAPLDDVAGAASGSAFVFARSGTVWSEQQKLVAGNGVTQAAFGDAGAVVGDTVFVGAPGHARLRGAVYTFHRTGTTWEGGLMVDGSGADLGGFGRSMFVSDDTLFVGASVGDGGTVFAYRTGKSDGEACTSPDECARENCDDGVCCNTPCAGSCGACSVAAGADVDGVCDFAPAGSLGDPACGALTCNGSAPDCAPCEQDIHCPTGLFCNAARSCVPQLPVGSVCNVAAGADCAAANCRVCSSSVCSNGVCEVFNPAPAAAGGEQGGCGCRTPGRRGHGTLQPGTLLAFALLLWAGRRARTARRS
jgi:hypothetical protein